MTNNQLLKHGKEFKVSFYKGKSFQKSLYLVKTLSLKMQIGFNKVFLDYNYITSV